MNEGVRAHHYWRVRACVCVLGGKGADAIWGQVRG